jgi:mannosyltransferase
VTPGPAGTDPAGRSPAAGQRGQTATPPDPAARAAVPLDPGTGAAEPPEATAQGRPGGWAAAAAKYAPVGVAAAVMAVLGIWGLARDSSMGNDEVATRWAALLSLRDLAHLLNTVDAVHGLYYLIMHVWVAVGSSPAVLRIPSVIAMVAAVALTAILARRLTGSGWAALFAGLIMALTPVITYYAQTARSYAMVVTCVLAATLALLHALDAEVTGASGPVVARRWVLYGALVTLGGYLNELSLLVLAAHGVTVLLARYGRRVLPHWIAAAVTGAVLVLPLVIISIRENGAVHWITRPGLADLRILFQDYFGVTAAAGILVFVCAVVAVLPPDGWWTRRRAAAGSGAGAKAGPSAEAPWWSSGGISLPSVAAPLLVVPAALLFGESLVATPLYVDRYVLYGEAGAALLAGAGMYRIGRWLRDAASQRALLWAPGVVVCVLVLLAQIGPQQRVRTPESRAYDFGSASRFVGAHAHPGDGVLFFGTFYRKARLGYPRDFTKVSDFAMAVSPQQAGTFRGRDKPFRLIEPLILQHDRIWVIGKEPSDRLPPGEYQAESMELRTNFVLVLTHRFRGMVVTLWQRR